MRLRNHRTWFALLTVATVAAILLACLYPFGFAARHGGIGPVGALVASWARPPKPIDFLLNIALYAPLFTKKTPLGFSQWVSTTSQSRVEIAARDPLHPARLAFSRDEFEVKGVLPDPGRLA